MTYGAIALNSTLVGGYGHFGTMANTEENGVWFMQLRYEW